MGRRKESEGGSNGSVVSDDKAIKAQAVTAAKTRRHQTIVFFLTYITYASLYFTRKPFSVVKKTLMKDPALEGFDSQALNLIETTFLLLYAVGQFSIGPLGDKYGAKMMLTVGFVGSAAMTSVCGYSSSVTPFVIAWGVNGLFQAGGFPLVMKALAPWFPREARGSVLGMWTTCQQIGGVASTAFAGYVLQTAGWRSAFLLPATWVTVCGVALYMFLVEDPTTVGLKPPAETAPSAKASSSSSPSAKPPNPGTLSYWSIIKLPYLLNLGVAYFCIKLVRYTLMFWLPFFLEDRFGYPPATAAYLSTLFDIGGAVGSVACGYLSDKFAGGRRMFVAAPMAVLCALGLFQYTTACEGGLVMNGIVMALVGLTIAGPDSVLGGAACTDVCERAGAGAAVVTTASGIVNGVGSVGAILQASLATYVSTTYGWDALFGVLGMLCLVGAAAVVPYILADLRVAAARVKP